MAKSTVLGKRGRGDAADGCETRKRRASRRAAAGYSDELDIFEDDSAGRPADSGVSCEDAAVVIVDDSASTGAKKRRVGRPRKHPLCESAAVQPLVEAGVVDENAKPAAHSVGKSYLRTPTTPRHHDVLGNVQTPKRRVQLVGRLPLTPQTPKSPSSAPATLYNNARQLFARSARPDRLVGRESEVAELRTFLDDAISSRSGRSIYISGPPGTGKSAFVSQVCEALGEVAGVRMTSVNCMSIKSSREICAKLVADLSSSSDSASQESLEGLKALFFPRKSSDDTVYVVTLDEIDHLLTLDHEILYSLFEWSLNKSSRLILVGIANALDLTDRFLPRLKARSLRPQLLAFVPYTASQIASVITTRLKTLSTDPSYVPFVQPAAIQFCSKKVASQTGDLRKAFDLIRRLIDIVEMETRAKEVLQQEQDSSPLAENPNLSSPAMTPSRRQLSHQPLAHLTPETAPRANIAHAARVAAAAFNNGTSQRLKTLNLQQKAALCALVSLEKRKAAALRARAFQTPTKEMREPPSVRKLHELYGQLCRKEGTLAALERGEFAEVVSSLEGLGLVRPADLPRAKAAARALGGAEERCIVSAVSEKEVEAALDGVAGGILRGLLVGGD